MDRAEKTKPRPQIVFNTFKGFLDTCPRRSKRSIKQLTKRAVTTRPQPKDKKQQNFIGQAFAGEPFQYQMPASPSCMIICPSKSTYILRKKKGLRMRLMYRPKRMKAVTSEENSNRLTFKKVSVFKLVTLSLLSSMTS